MTPSQFAIAISEAFAQAGWSTARFKDGVFPTAYLDVWTRSVSERCTAARAESLVCRFVRDNKLDPAMVRFSVERGHLLVQQRSDLGSSLADRSVWKRLKK